MANIRTHLINLVTQELKKNEPGFFDLNFLYGPNSYDAKNKIFLDLTMNRVKKLSRYDLEFLVYHYLIKYRCELFDDNVTCENELFGNTHDDPYCDDIFILESFIKNIPDADVTDMITKVKRAIEDGEEEDRISQEMFKNAKIVL
jgi:hypothetical protein